MSVVRLSAEGSPVLLEERPIPGDLRLGLVTLNAPATLNSLSLPMIELIAPMLDRWERDPAIVAAVLAGAGPRAFCAGGDIQALYLSMRRNHEAGHTVDAYAETFFEQEYRLDFRLHRYPKPVICLGHGIVMGGGLGLFSASHFRIVTEATRIAMPEVTIGLFPDAGATWILRSLAPCTALYLGVTGSHLNAADALHLGIATHAVGAEHSLRIVETLAGMDWHADTSDAARIAATLDGLKPAALPNGVVQAHEATLARRLPAGLRSARDAVAMIRSLEGMDPWFDRGIATMTKGNPASIGIVVGQLERAASLSLADSFRLELIAATRCARFPDFAEGVRALLIDKDNAPRWRYPEVASLPDEYVQAHFEAPWADHPLADLEEESIR